MHFVTRRNIFLCNIFIWLNQNTFSTSSPQAVEHNWHNLKPGECYSNATYIECELRDDDARVFDKNLLDGLSNDCRMQTDAHVWAELGILKMKINLSKFLKTNCYQIADIMNREDITYKAIVHYSNTFGVRKLRLIYSTHDLKLPAKLFQDSKDMTRMSMWISGTNKSGDFYENLFAHAVNLEMIKIQALDFAKALTFKSVNVKYPLKYLDLSRNQIQVLPDDMFATLPELNYLKLHYNILETLPINAFAKQQKLLILDLSVNFLDQLPAGIFKHTPLLLKLILNTNRFFTPTSIIENISGLRYLYKLDLHYNRLKTLQGDVSVGYETLISSFAARVDSDSLVSLMPNLSYISALEGKQFESQSVNTKEIDLTSNEFEHFDMAWLQQAHFACDFQIDLSDNDIGHINITTTTFNATNSCGTKIKFPENLLDCDCKLTWLANNNYLRNPFTLQCSVTQFENSTITQIHRSESCDWLPGLCPAECVCRLDAEAVLINCEGATLTDLQNLPRPEPFARKLSMLSLSHTNFRQLPTNTTIGYANVTHLNASHNQLTVLRPIELPAKLLVLDVRHNRLDQLSAEFVSAYLNESGSLQQLFLAGNPWKCDCSAELLLHAVSTQRKLIADVGEMVCDNRPSVRLLDAKFEDFCATKPVNSTLIFTSAAIIIGMLLIVVFYYKYQLPVHVWLYSHGLLRCCVSECELDKDKNFDAFISYAHQDAHFVNHTLVPQLEQGVPPFRICTHERNWLAGAYIPEQIDESIAQSCRTIIILSQHFIESDWARMEFRTAHQCALNEGRARIIIIKYGEITQPERVDKELQAYLDMNTYLEWSDTRFWQKLRYAMPHKRGEASNAGMLELNRRVYVTGQDEELSCA